MKLTEKIVTVILIIGAIVSTAAGVKYLMEGKEDSRFEEIVGELAWSKEKLDIIQTKVDEMENQGENVIELKETLRHGRILYDNAEKATRIEHDYDKAERLLEEIRATIIVPWLTDIIEPTIEIISPEPGLVTSENIIILKAKVTDDKSLHDELDVTVEAPAWDLPQRVWLDAKGYFSKRVSLTEGLNPITIVVVDRANNTATKTVIVERMVTPWATYAIILVIVALVLAAIAIFRKSIPPTPTPKRRTNRHPGPMKLKRDGLDGPRTL